MATGTSAGSPVTIWLEDNSNGPFDQSGFNIDFMTGGPKIGDPGGKWTSDNEAYYIDTDTSYVEIDFRQDMSGVDTDGRTFGSFIVDKSYIYGGSDDDTLKLTDARASTATMGTTHSAEEGATISFTAETATTPSTGRTATTRSMAMRARTSSMAAPATIPWTAVTAATR
jgi:hypothetical protein